MKAGASRRLNLHSLAPTRRWTFRVVLVDRLMIGNAGQANYVAGNVFEALAHYRRGMDLPPSPSTGASGEVGHVAASPETRPTRTPRHSQSPCRSAVLLDASTRSSPATPWRSVEVELKASRSDGPVTVGAGTGLGGESMPRKAG